MVAVLLLQQAPGRRVGFRRMEGKALVRSDKRCWLKTHLERPLPVPRQRLLLGVGQQVAHHEGAGLAQLSGGVVEGDAMGLQV